MIKQYRSMIKDVQCRKKRIHKNKIIDKEPSIRWWELTGKNKKNFKKDYCDRGVEYRRKYKQIM